MKKPLCLYHDECNDGFMAAYIVYHAMKGDVELRAAQYGQKPPLDDMEDRTVYLVDFSYKRPQMEDILNEAARVIVIDHHVSAEKELQGLVHANLTLIFDMNHSGAMLTWEYFYPDEKAPELVHFVEDRDLWRFELKETREVHAWLSSYPRKISDWIKAHIMWDQAKKEAITVGQFILRSQQIAIEDAVKSSVRTVMLDGYEVPAVCVPKSMAFDACHLLLSMYPDCAFAVAYFDSDRGRIISLRSRREEAFNVARIAENHGGGGHRSAAGFTAKLSRQISLL